MAVSGFGCGIACACGSRRHITEQLQAPKKHEEVSVVLPDGRASRIWLDRTFRECLGLAGEIDLRVHVRGVDRHVPEPRADRVDVDTGTQEVGRGRVSAMSLAT